MAVGNQTWEIRTRFQISHLHDDPGGNLNNEDAQGQSPISTEDVDV